jgi:signal transduction histidine kinase
MGQDIAFARLVSLACHDLRTPLATVSGFAWTLERTGELGETEAKYVAMIIAAAGQMTALLEGLGLAASVAGGRYDPRLVEVDSLTLAEAAAEALGTDRVGVSGAGTMVLVDGDPARRAVTDLARCALRHGGLEHVDLRVAGPVLELGPVTPASAPVLAGEDLRDLGAAVAGLALRATGAKVELEGAVLRITLTTAN